MRSFIGQSVLPNAVTHQEEVFVTELRSFPEGWYAVFAVLALAATLWFVVWMYRHEGRVGASNRRRLILACLRCTTLVLLAAILLDPVRVRILRRSVDSYAIVLVDDSSSMDLEDSYRSASDGARVRAALDVESVPSTSRIGIVNELLLKSDRIFLRELALNNRVSLYTFSHEPTLVGTIRAARELRPRSGGGNRAKAYPGSDGGDASAMLSVDAVSTDFPAMGRSTNIERAVRRTMEALGAAPLAAIVVLSDGGFNDGASAVDTARFARDRDVPVYVIGIGDPSPPRNVRVSEVLAPENAFKHDPFTISARLTSEGLDGRTIHVELSEHSLTDDSARSVVDSRQVTVKSGGAIEPIIFVRRQENVGRFSYAVTVDLLEDESVADDNSKQVTVNVIEARTKVLLIAGAPSWEYRFISRLLQRDESVDVSCWLQSADLRAVRDGNTIIDHMPRLPEELFEYDVVILLDPDKEEFDSEWCRLADRYVTEYGGGLLYAAARLHSPAFLRAPELKPLHDLLPVTMDPDVDLILNQVGHYQLSGSPLIIPESAFGHPIMQLADDAVSTKLAWQEIGAVHWFYPVLREKPVARVLMRHGDRRMDNSYGPRVLAAAQFIGAGRTGFVGFDGTWRWRGHAVEAYNRFWIQFVRHLAEGKLLGGAKRGMLLTDSDQFSIGEAVTVTARLFDERFEPIRADEVMARYTVGEQEFSFMLETRRDRPGWFEGSFVPNQIGSYRISVNVPGISEGAPVEVFREIRVARPNLEILRPQMDKAALMTLARESGEGRYFDLDEMFDLPAMIPDLHEEISVRSNPTTLWDNWKVLTILVALLSVEWFVRKWSRLL